MVNQLWPFQGGKRELASGVHTLVTYRLAYCTVLNIRHSLKTVQNLQLEQNAVTRMLTSVSHKDHIAAVFFPSTLAINLLPSPIQGAGVNFISNIVLMF